MTIEHKRSSKAEIEDLIRARYSLVWITSPEEERVEDSLKRLCVEREMRLEVWSITEGFKTIANGQGTRDVKDPMKAIDHVIRAEGRALFVLRDFHPFLKEPAVVRRLRDAARELRKTKKTLEAQVDAAKTDAQKARAEAARARANADAQAEALIDFGSAGGGPNPVELAKRAQEVYDAINDILSEMRNNVVLVQGELPRLKADGDTMRAVADAVEALVDSAETAKGALRGLRELAETK